MNNRFLNILAIISAVLFLSSCAVFVRDDGYRHRGYWRRHSSIQQSGNPANHQRTALNSGAIEDHP